MPGEKEHADRSSLLFHAHILHPVLDCGLWRAFLRGGHRVRVGFIVTNMTGWSRKVVKFYNGRGTAEQWIKEGKYAVKWTALVPELQRQPDAASALRAGV